MDFRNINEVAAKPHSLRTNGIKMLPPARKTNREPPKRTNRDYLFMTGKTTKTRQQQKTAFGNAISMCHKQTSRQSLDYLIGGHKQIGWYSEAERFRGL